MSNMSTTQKITFGLGAVYVLIGILGFIPGLVTNNLLLGIFAVNTLHNFTHIVVGLVLVAGSMSAGNTLMVNKIMAVVFLLLTVVSLIAPNLEQVPQNMPDTILHAATTLITFYLGFMSTRRTAVTA
jgi:hypothetical protein